MSLRLKRESVLNLTLEGSVGSFNVGRGRSNQNSLDVKYFLTHVGLDFSGGASEDIMRHMAPVREIFEFEHLDFDEIMQRDIDDARVSSELIPYLLDPKSHDLIKLFPPIVVVVLPIHEHENRPADLYPKVESQELPASEDEPARITLRAGEVGNEVFQFEQPLLGGKPLQHDLVRLKLNTNKTRLVIVDGQHRAMALLALYRNLKGQWSDEKRAPFKEYYAEWTPKYIQEFELREINLPVMFCTFPDLSEGYKGELDLKKAARAIFLTLNKTARKVSNSRNTLLDDNDLLAFFLRRTLSVVKQKDARDRFPFRIFNVELDQFNNRMRIEDPIAITGVNHIYYLIEHLMLNKGDEDVKGAKPRSGKFFNRKHLTDVGLMGRLDGRNLLGAEIADSTSRDNFTVEVAEKLGQRFDERYGRFIVSIFEQFSPYEKHNRAVLNLETRIASFEDRKLRPILFEGQGIGRVFESHRANLQQRLKEGGFETDVPKIEALKDNLDATRLRIDNAVQSLRLMRAEEYIKGVSDKSKLNKEGEIVASVNKFFDYLYDFIFKTVAFQTALICTFFSEIERVHGRLDEQESIDIDDCFNEYVKMLNDFFIPQRSSQFRKLVSLFRGELQGEIADWKLVGSPMTFRAVVYKGEMQPDQWPKYKYLLLEIWRPERPPGLVAILKNERSKCRNQIFTNLYEQYRDSFLNENMKHEEALNGEERRAIFDDAYKAFTGFLKVVSVPREDVPDKTSLKGALEGGRDDARSEEVEEELWEFGEE